MAMIQCSECGRAVSDRAPACVGCGAPLAPAEGGVALAPRPTPSVRVSPAVIRRRAALATVMLVLGIVLAAHFEQGAVHRRAGSVIAALLIIGGLTWLLVTLIHALASRR